MGICWLKAARVPLEDSRDHYKTVQAELNDDSSEEDLKDEENYKNPEPTTEEREEWIVSQWK